MQSNGFLNPDGKPIWKDVYETCVHSINIIEKTLLATGLLIDIVPDAHLYCSYPLGEAALPESFSFSRETP